MDETMMYATVALAGLNALFSGGLLFVYGKNYKAVKAPFTIGLMLFAGVFLVQNLLAAYAYLSMMMYFPDALHPYMMGIMALEALALGTMLYASNQ